MPSKTEEYLALAQRTANGLTRYWESWTAYLTTASRLYKYRFEDQLMIYAQRPDATACADYDIWNNRMNRYVRRGFKGIALLDESSGYPRLHYVFDVSDTGVRRNSRDPDLWQYNDDLKQPVSDALTAAYGISHERFSQQLADIAGKLVADYWDNNSEDIRAIVDGSFLMDYDSTGLEMQFKSAAAISVTYTLLERCGFEPDGFFDKDSFQAIYDFSTPDTVYALGAAVSDISREVLRTVERAVKTTIRRRNNERSQHILFLQKRDRPADIEPAWVQLGQTEDGFNINQYFVDHPEMVLGNLELESTQYGHDLTVAPIEDANLADQLTEAVQHIEGQYTAVEIAAPDVADAEVQRKTLPADPTVKNFSYTVVDGEIYYRENSIMTQIELSDNAKGRVAGMVELRQIVNELIDQQLNDFPDEDIKASQAKLNYAYDAFTAKYGLINDKKNARLFDDDSSYYLLCSLENLDENKNLKSKADMFTKRTIRPERIVTSVDTPSEALAVSIGEHGKVDLPYMAELLGTPGNYERITTELSGVIFKDPAADADDPEAGWQTADEYLSGNVRDKLRMAQLAAESRSEFKGNVDALTKAQPKDLEASEIDVRLGATWLAPSIVQQFMMETFQPPYRIRYNNAITVRYSPYTSEWRISNKSATGFGDIMATETYGTRRANAYKILEDTLNLRDSRVYDTIEEDGKEKRVLNQNETTLAQQKQQAIKDAFAGWVWKDPQRRTLLVKRYNELFNSTRPREYDGSHIHFVGMNPEINLREHQRNAVAHVLYDKAAETCYVCRCCRPVCGASGG